MNKFLIVGIAIVLAPGVGLALSVMYSVWYSGVGQQPLWLSLFTVVSALALILFCIKSIVDKNLKKITIDKVIPGIIGALILPLAVGLIAQDLLSLELFPDSGEIQAGDGILQGLQSSLNMIDIVSPVLSYITLPFNLYFLFKTILIPMLRKYKLPS